MGEDSRDEASSPHRMDDRQFVRRLIVVSTFLALGLGLWLLLDLLLLIFGSVIVAVLLHEASVLVARWTPVPRRLAMVATVLLLFLGFALATWIFGAEIQAQVSHLGDRIPEAWRSFEDRLRSTEPGRQFLGWLHTTIIGQSGIMTKAGGLAVSLGSAIAAFLVILVGGIYLAFQPSLYRNGLLKLLSRRARPAAEETLNLSGGALRLWLIGQFFAMLIVGILTGLGAWAIGLPSSIALGLIAALLEFIPFLGPILMAVPALLLALTQDGQTVVMTLLLYTVIQQLEGNVITPLVQRQTVSLPPALTLFALVAMGIVFGPLGVLFAAPLTVVAYVAVKELYIRGLLHESTDIPGEDERSSLAKR